MKRLLRLLQRSGSIAPLRRLLHCAVWAGVFGMLWAQTPPAPPSPSPGPAEEPDCLKCHEPMKARLKKKYVHSAVEAGCTSCHIEHHKEAGSKSAHHLSAQPPELCLTCHDAKDEKVAKAHHGQPFAKAECTKCHDPHSSDAPKLVLERPHGPFGARQCEGCHAAPENEKVKLTAQANDLCYRCHDEFKRRLEGAKVKHSLLSSGGSCVDCHDPHVSRENRFLNKPVAALCGDCHSGVTEGLKFGHEPVQKSCVYCHDAHGSDFPRSLHADTHDLCLGCHSPAAVKIVNGKDPVALFGGRVTLAAKTFDDLKYLDLTDGKGHPMHGHPVQAPAAKDRPEMNCRTCHQPHGSAESKQFLVKEKQELCFGCHQK